MGMYHKKAIYKFTKKVNKKAAPKKAAVFVEKQVGGAKNGGTRMVRAKKLANDVPTVDAAAPGTSKNFFANHVRKVRASLTAGTVAIVPAPSGVSELWLPLLWWLPGQRELGCVCCSLLQVPRSASSWRAPHRGR